MQKTGKLSKGIVTLTNQITPLLETKHITKVFLALHLMMYLSVLPGEVHPIWENEVGKSTLMKIVMGQYKATSGEFG